MRMRPFLQAALASLALVAGALLVVTGACGPVETVGATAGGVGGSGGSGGSAGTAGAGGAGGGGGSVPAADCTCACVTRMSAGGCGDVCNDTLNGDPGTPNFCNGHAALAGCATCLTAHCQIEDTSGAHLCM
jgi:hypothetical protein